MDSDYATHSFYTGLRDVFEASDANHDSQLTEKEIKLLNKATDLTDPR